MIAAELRTAHPHPARTGAQLCECRNGAGISTQATNSTALITQAPPSADIEIANPNNLDRSTSAPRLDLGQKADALRIQQRLIELKFLDGTPDGIWGRRSRKALSEFRASRGLGKDDAWDETTQDILLDGDRIHRVVHAAFTGGWTAEIGQCGSSSDTVPLRITYQPI